MSTFLHWAVVVIWIGGTGYLIGRWDVRRQRFNANVEKIGAALRAECLAIYGTNWSFDVAWRFARVAIKAME